MNILHLILIKSITIIVVLFIFRKTMFTDENKITFIDVAELINEKNGERTNRDNKEIALE